MIKRTLGQCRAFFSAFLNKTAAANKPTEQPSTDGPQTFKYRKPPDDQKGNKEIVRLCQNRNLRGAIHVIRKGGEENLHSHKTIDGFWMVLSGKVRFYGENDIVIAELNPLEGVLIPRNTRYWFESVGDQDLELLQVLAFDPGKGFSRDNHAKPNFDHKKIKWFDGSTGANPKAAQSRRV